MPKVSVIVPIYGVEKYIERCARSLFEQTLDDMEFVFVNDCTKDNSINVLQRVMKDYPNRNEQIKIIYHTENKGLPQARKTGVLASTGDYIAHCDSDDWMELDAYQLLYAKAISSGADMVFFDYCRTDGILREEFITDYNRLNRDNLIVRMIAGQILYGVVFHLDKRHLYFDEVFEWPDYNMTEDLLFTCQLLIRASRIFKVNKVLYNYFYNQQSLTKSNDNKDKQLQSAGNVAKLIRVLDKSNLPNKGLCVLLCKMFMKHRYVDAVMSKEGYHLWLSIYPEVTPHVLFDRRVPSIMRIRYFLGYTRLYRLVKRMIK